MPKMLSPAIACPWLVVVLNERDDPVRAGPRGRRPDARLRLVLAVEVDEERREHLDVAALREPAGINAADARRSRFARPMTTCFASASRPQTSTSESIGWSSSISFSALMFWKAETTRAFGSWAAASWAALLPGTLSATAPTPCWNSSGATTSQTILPSSSDRRALERRPAGRCRGTSGRRHRHRPRPSAFSPPVTFAAGHDLADLGRAFLAALLRARTDCHFVAGVGQAHRESETFGAGAPDKGELHAAVSSLWVVSLRADRTASRAPEQSEQPLRRWRCTSDQVLVSPAAATRLRTLKRASDSGVSQAVKARLPRGGRAGSICYTRMTGAAAPAAIRSASIVFPLAS